MSMKLVKHTTYEMFYIEYPDGEFTADFYSLPYARQHLKDMQRQYADGRLPGASRKPAGAFK